MTGSTGLIGRSLLPLLQQSAGGLRLLVRGASAAGQNGTVVPGDLRQPDALRALVEGADALVHLAGAAHTTLRTPLDRTAAFAVNVTGTRDLLLAAQRAGVKRVILLSSAHVYAGRRGIALREDAPTEADDGYAGMKLEAEAAAHALAETGCSVVILRPCLTYGAGVRFNLQQLMRAVRAGYYVHPGGRDATRSFASVETVAAAIVHLLQPDAPPGTFNVADREAVSLRAWVDHLAALLQVRAPHTVPFPVLRAVAGAGTLAARAGLPAPLTGVSLQKLTENFSLSTDALAATGFQWPANQEAVLQAMVKRFLSDVRNVSKAGS